MSVLNTLSTLPLASNFRPKAATAPAAGAKAAGGTSANGGASAGSPDSTANLGSTFLSLLVQELQNQDPTAPMDSTAMVGQMISLNQLNQLTSINQVLSNAYGGSTGSTSKPTNSGANANALPAAQAAMRLFNNNGPTMRPAVSSSVTLPAS